MDKRKSKREIENIVKGKKQGMKRQKSRWAPPLAQGGKVYQKVLEYD